MGHLHCLIAFDLDGTLIDSRRDLADSANELIAAHGGAPLDVDAITRMVGGGAALLVRRAFDVAGVPHPPDAVPRFLDIYDRRLLTHTTPYAGISDMLRRARAAGSLALLTNKPIAPTERLIDAFGWRELFTRVVGGDGPYPRKPDPASLRALMADVGATPETTLMVGDSITDHETAQRAGTACCLVAFGFETFPRERFTERDVLAWDAGELGTIIERFAHDAR